MFELLKEFFDRKSSRLKKLKYQKLELVYLLSKELCKLNSPDYYHLREGLGISSENKEPSEMFNYIINIKVHEANIEYCYQIRGSLITVFKNREILKFVDQTIQYSGCLYYPHDISINCSKKTLENILTSVRIKLKELKDEKNTQNKKD